MKGLSERNLVYMQTFASSYPYFPFAQLQSNDSKEDSFTQAPLAQITWYHHISLLDKVRNPDERLFYIAKTIENGWSRNVLIHQIESELYERQGKVIANFKHALPSPQSDLAKETFKNPYLFDFLAMGEKIQERELEKALVVHIQKFKLELGKGFAYVGNQFHLEVSDKDYFLDLLFFNYHLNCFVVFELKVGEFKPEFAGKLNFYINTVDDKIQDRDHKPTIGILLCKTPDKTVVEYALRGITTPLGVSDYELSKVIPRNLRTDLPTVEELEAEIDREYEELKTPAQKRLQGLKEKLADLKQEEIKQTANTDILQGIFDKSLMPLFRTLLKRLEDFEDLFMNCSYEWQGKNKSITDINKLAASWKEEEFLQSRMEFHFSYWLNGLKKSGTDSFNTGIRLNYKTDMYWYGLTLMRYNNQQPIVKKLYHEQLSKADIELIAGTVYNSILESIEGQVKASK